MTANITPTICRLCIAHCGVLATVEDGRVTKVTGDPNNPMFKGYTCPKGRALPELHNQPGRLLQPLKRNASGNHEVIDSERAIAEIGEKLEQLIRDHGPRSVAFYTGTNSVQYPAAGGMANAFSRAIQSPMFFTSNTIDQPGKQIAASAHGHWLGGDLDFDQADVWMLVGVNPIISKSAGIPGQNPAQKLKDAVNRGMKLIVVDPRVSDVARRANIHIQPRPGEDTSILAGIIRIIIEENLYDADFVKENVEGFDSLREHVQPFTPDYVAKRADISAEQLLEAAHCFAAGRGAVNTGTGSSFAMHGNILEYLALSLNTICGRWVRAGENVTHPNAMLPAFTPKAQAFPPYKGWGYGEKMRVRGLTDAACGMPTAALADEILLEGEGQVRALICIGGNPMAAWPDQVKTHKAMEKLELLVSLDVELSSTARLADYVIATKMSMETPGMSQGGEIIKYFGNGIGYPAAYGQYSPRLVDPPAGSDLVEEWEFFYDLAVCMDLEMYFVVYYGFSKYREAPPVVVTLNKDHKPTTEELYAQMCGTARIPFEEIQQHPHGKIFDVEEQVQPKDLDCEARLCVNNATLMVELDQVAAEDFESSHNTPGFPFRLIPRRNNNFVNSSGRGIDKLNGGKTWNPAYIHPQDMAALDLSEGDSIRIRTRYDAIPGIAEADASLRPGVVAMSHAFGGLPGEEHDFRQNGSNTGRLVRTDVDYDPLTGMPRMGNIPISIEALSEEQ